MSRTRVKICGITRREDAVAAVEAGADAIGLVFYPDSPRYVDPDAAADVIAGLAPLVSVVGLFVDPDRSTVEKALQTLPLDLLQFHGDESPDWCAGFGKPWMKAIRVGPETDVPATMERYSAASAVLLDAWKPGVPGGTGERFDWQRAPRGPRLPMFLAGGLTPANVGEAIAAVRPFAVDVSGGVEQAPGLKSRSLIEEFIAAVQAADSLENVLVSERQA